MASFLIIFKTACLVPGFVLLAYGVLIRDIVWISYAGGVFGLVLLLLIFNMVLTSRLRCPLCMVPPLQNRGCSKHRNVQRILGSHRLHVALSILGRGNFSCPYCGEKTAMEARIKNR